MYNPVISLAYYWFGKNGPTKGILLDESGLKTELDYKNRKDIEKIEEVKHPIALINLISTDNTWTFTTEHPVLKTYIQKFDFVSSKEAIKTCLELRQKLKTEEEQIRSNPEKWLERELKNHDWYFEFSDDHRVWEKGAKHYGFICGLLMKVSIKTGQDLWGKYAPTNFKFPIKVPNGIEIGKVYKNPGNQVLLVLDIFPPNSFQRYTSWTIKVLLEDKIYFDLLSINHYLELIE